MYIIELLALTVILFFVWLLNKRYYFGKIFVLKVTPLKTSLIKGYVSQSFIKDVEIISKTNKVRGHIFGLKANNRITLSFSKRISSSNAQRFRNVFPYISPPPNSGGPRRKKC